MKYPPPWRVTKNGKRSHHIEVQLIGQPRLNKKPISQLSPPRKPKHKEPPPNADEQGRPTEYRPHYDELVFNYALLMLSEEEMAHTFAISVETFNQWKILYPSFAESIKDGGEKADGEIVNALRKSALGYEHDAVKIFCTDNGGVTKVKYVEKYAPNPVSIQFWLRNRKRDKWKNTEHKEISGPGGAPLDQNTNINIDVTNATTEQLKQLQSLIDAGLIKTETDAG